MRPAEATVPASGINLFRGPDAAPRTLGQLMFNSETQALERRVYKLYAPRLAGNFDAVWEPAASSLGAGPISGSGRIVWRRAGTPPYSHASIVAVFEGTFVEGQAKGDGQFWHRDGLVYHGGWLNGRFDGQGQIQLPGGRHYTGGFAAGRYHGRGEYVDETGAVYSGNFKDGLLDGEILVAPFDRLAYRADFSGGNEIVGNRIEETDDVLKQRPHLVQATRLSDARIGLSLDPSPPPGWFGTFSPSYVSSSDGATMKVYRSDPDIRSLWQGGRRLWVHHAGPKSPLESHASPGFSLSFENTGRQPLQIVGGYVAVRQSASYLRPIVEVLVEQDCGQPVIAEFRLNNYGWGQPRNAQITVEFRNRDGGVGASVSGAVSQGWPSAHINLATGLMNYGVNLPEIENFSPLRCSSTSSSGCLSELGNSGLFGNLADAIDLDGSSVVIPYTARLDFDWVQANGRSQSESLTFSDYVKVGTLPFQAECGEGGAFEEAFPNPFHLSLDRDNYTLPFGLNARVMPGQLNRWKFNIIADKASFHEFQIVLSLADGREIASRPVSLEYFRPSNPYANY